MAYCNNCKEEKGNDQKFCNVCGAELTASAPAETAATPPPAPSQPVNTAEQFQQHKQEAMNIFAKLGLGLQIAAIGAIVSFVFALILGIQLQSAASNPFAVLANLGAYLALGSPWLRVVLSAGTVVLAYFAGSAVGKTKVLFIAGIIALGGSYISALIEGWGAGMGVLVMLGGIAQLVGGFVALNAEK